MTTTEFWSLLVDCIATLLAAIAILLYVIFWFRDKTTNSYDVFDSTYMELLKIAMEHPSFRDPKKVSDYENAFSGDEKIQYELYAFMCWNFCETIYDKGDKELMKTWTVIIEAESRLHRKWFEQAENQQKFKRSFQDHISLNYPS